MANYSVGRYFCETKTNQYENRDVNEFESSGSETHFKHTHAHNTIGAHVKIHKFTQKNPFGYGWPTIWQLLLDRIRLNWIGLTRIARMGLI